MYFRSFFVTCNVFGQFVLNIATLMALLNTKLRNDHPSTFGSPNQKKNQVGDHTERSTEVATSTVITKLNQSYDPGHECFYRRSWICILITKRQRNYQINRKMVKGFGRRNKQNHYNATQRLSNWMGCTAVTFLYKKKQNHQKKRNQDFLKWILNFERRTNRFAHWPSGLSNSEFDLFYQANIELQGEHALSRLPISRENNTPIEDGHRCLQ